MCDFSDLEMCRSCPHGKLSNKVCLTKTPSLSKLKKKFGNKMDAQRLRAAFLKGVEWPQNAVIRVGFYRDADYSKSKADWVQATIEKYVSPLIGLTFEWDSPIEKSPVRIRFNPNAGAYSHVGTECLDVPTNEETMNLGWLDTEEDYDFEAAKGNGTVVVHEFGHMLGMIHEHSRADSKLPWNCEAVYQSLHAPPNSWDCETVKSNVLIPYTTDQFNGSAYDPKSIMHYFFEKNYFCGDVNIPHNVFLSQLDKEWLSKVYPPKSKNARNSPIPAPKYLRSSEDGNNSYLWMFVVVLVVALLGYIVYKWGMKRKRGRPKRFRFGF